MGEEIGKMSGVGQSVAPEEHRSTAVEQELEHEVLNCLVPRLCYPVLLGCARVGAVQLDALLFQGLPQQLVEELPPSVTVQLLDVLACLLFLLRHPILQLGTSLVLGPQGIGPAMPGVVVNHSEPVLVPFDCSPP